MYTHKPHTLLKTTLCIIFNSVSDLYTQSWHSANKNALSDSSTVFKQTSDNRYASVKQHTWAHRDEILHMVALILHYFTEFNGFAGRLRHSGWRCTCLQNIAYCNFAMLPQFWCPVRLRFNGWWEIMSEWIVRIQPMI